MKLGSAESLVVRARKGDNERSDARELFTNGTGTIG